MIMVMNMIIKQSPLFYVLLVTLIFKCSFSDWFNFYDNLMLQNLDEWS